MKSTDIIAINGESWCHPLTGIERLAIEVTQYLDELVQPGQMELVVPANARNRPELKNIRLVVLPQEAHFFPTSARAASSQAFLASSMLAMSPFMVSEHVMQPGRSG